MENVEKYKYLGNIISHDLGNRSDICCQVKQTYIIIYVQGNVLARKFYMCTENVKKSNCLLPIVLAYVHCSIVDKSHNGRYSKHACCL